MTGPATSELTAQVDPGETEVRVSDKEREHAAGLLTEAAAEGRLDVDELEGRLEGAYRARTRADLAALMRDLPLGRPVRAPVGFRSPRQDLRAQATAFALVSLLLVAVWAASGAGYFWPIWPVLGWGIGIGKLYTRARRARS